MRVMMMIGFGVWLGRNIEEIRGGPSGDVVAQQSGAGLSLQVIVLSSGNDDVFVRFDSESMLNEQGTA